MGWGKLHLRDEVGEPLGGAERGPGCEDGREVGGELGDVGPVQDAVLLLHAPLEEVRHLSFALALIPPLSKLSNLVFEAVEVFEDHELVMGVLDSVRVAVVFDEAIRLDIKLSCQGQQQSKGLISTNGNVMVELAPEEVAPALARLCLHELRPVEGDGVQKARITDHIQG